MKPLVGFLTRYSPRLLILAVVAAMLTGAANTAFLAIINSILARPLEVETRLWPLIAVMLAIPLARILAQGLLAYLGQKAILDLRMDLSRNILAAPLRALEQRGTSRILAALTTDVLTISTAVIQVPNVAMNLTLVGTCLCYLIWLDAAGGLAITAVVLVTAVLYRVVGKRSQLHFQIARDEEDRLYDHFQTLTEGAKELKLNFRRKTAFLDEYLERTGHSVQKNNALAQTYFAGAGSVNYLFFSSLIAGWVVLPPMLGLSFPDEIYTGFVLVLLFMFVPLDRLTVSVPILGKAIVSIGKIRELTDDIAGTVTDTPIEPEPAARFQTLKIDRVTHAYHREREDETFVLGPITMRIEPGELVFIVGGNGSGKTTLAKLILGLYLPESGEIRLDNEPVDHRNREQYRQYFSAVFSDFYLLENLLGVDPIQIDEKARAYLKNLHLDHKVKIEGGRLSTIALSQGQRKRLALLTAYLEDRPIYLFDEWAADQDPVFKELFYRTLLPELKSRGKTVLVISHDDHYYDTADRIIKLTHGQIEYDNHVP